MDGYWPCWPAASLVAIVVGQPSQLWVVAQLVALCGPSWLAPVVVVDWPCGCVASVGVVAWLVIWLLYYCGLYCVAQLLWPSPVVVGYCGLYCIVFGWLLYWPCWLFRNILAFVTDISYRATTITAAYLRQTLFRCCLPWCNHSPCTC